MKYILILALLVFAGCATSKINYPHEVKPYVSYTKEHKQPVTSPVFRTKVAIVNVTHYGSLIVREFKCLFTKTPLPPYKVY